MAKYLKAADVISRLSRRHHWNLAWLWDMAEEMFNIYKGQAAILTTEEANDFERELLRMDAM